MHKHIERTIARMRDSGSRGAIIFLALTLVVGVSVSIVSAKIGNNGSAREKSLTVDMYDGPEIAVAGSSYASSTNSWPGEVVSLENIAVQPARDGTLLSWNAHVGKRVTKGEVLGRLSPPPAMPETIAMLADARAMTAMAEAEYEAKKAYVAKRLIQLEALRAETERNASSRTTLLDGGSPQGMIALRRETVRSILRGSLITTYPMLSGSLTLPAKWQDYRLRDPFGAQDFKLRDGFQPVFFAALAAVNDLSKTPDAAGVEYFKALIKLVDASLPDEAALMSSELTQLKDMVHEDQNEFIMAIDALREAEFENADKQKMLATDIAMIDEEIAMLAQDLAEAEGNLRSKTIAESTIRDSVSADAVIVAPISGVVSSITKRPGEFVGPGMPVATISGHGERFIRFRIPSNAKKPEQGERVTVLRTGFGSTKQQAVIIGVGGALDGNGAYMADAKLDDLTDWPVGTSVRILPPQANETVSVNYSSIMWENDKPPYVWRVSEAGRVFAQPLSLGRTLGDEVEVYEGLRSGDRYIADPTPEITEDMLIEDMNVGSSAKTDSSAPMDHVHMPGMEM